MMHIHKSQQFCCESQGLGPLVPGFDPEPVAECWRGWGYEFIAMVALDGLSKCPADILTI